MSRRVGGHTLGSDPAQSRHMIGGTVRSGGFVPQGALPRGGLAVVGRAGAAVLALLSLGAVLRQAGHDVLFADMTITPKLPEAAVYLKRMVE